MSKLWFYVFLLIISSYHLSAGQEETESTILQGHPDDIYWDTTFHYSRQPQAYVDAIVKNDVLYILAYQYYDNGNLVNAILRWSEAEGWEVICTGVPDGVAAIEVYGESIYIGGTFEEVYGIPAANVAVWDPHNGWSALGAGLTSPTPEYNQVLDLAVTENGILYASGLFTKSADKTVEGIAWWNGVSWQALGNSYLEGMCWNIVADGNMLYAGRIGERIATHPNGYDSYTVAQWDGTQWREVGNNLTGNPYRLLVRNDVVYVAGALSVGDSETACYVVRWDGTTWQKLGEEFGSNVDNITEIALTNSGELFAAGGNWEGNAAQLNKIALWNGGQWQGLGSGVGKGGINEMVAIDDDIIITGSPLLQEEVKRQVEWLAGARLVPMYLMLLQNNRRERSYFVPLIQQ
jgi:hypothetical protein